MRSSFWSSPSLRRTSFGGMATASGLSVLFFGRNVGRFPVDALRATTFLQVFVVLAFVAWWSDRHSIGSETSPRR